MVSRSAPEQTPVEVLPDLLDPATDEDPVPARPRPGDRRRTSPPPVPAVVGAIGGAAVSVFLVALGVMVLLLLDTAPESVTSERVAASVATALPSPVPPSPVPPSPVPPSSSPGAPLSGAPLSGAPGPGLAEPGSVRPGPAGPAASAPGGAGVGPVRPSAADGPAAAAEPPATVAPERSAVVPVTVLNNSRRTGLAARGAARFTAGGWPVAAVGNFRGRIPVTTVYYDPGLEASARAFAASFDGVVRVRPRFATLPARGVVVVLTREFAV